MFGYRCSLLSPSPFPWVANQFGQGPLPVPPSSRWISKSNSSRNESNLSMKRGMRRKRVLRSCNSKSVRRSSSLTPILQTQRNTGAGFLKSCSTVTFQKILNLKKFDLWETMLCQLRGQMDLARSLPMISSR